jgi:hypothetical protein
LDGVIVLPVRPLMHVCLPADKCSAEKAPANQVPLHAKKDAVQPLIAHTYPATLATNDEGMYLCATVARTMRGEPFRKCTRPLKNQCVRMAEEWLGSAAV